MFLKAKQYIAEIKPENTQMWGLERHNQKGSRFAQELLTWLCC